MNSSVLTQLEPNHLSHEAQVANAQLRYAGLEKFRSDNGQLLTRRLFWEVSSMYNDKSKTYYSLSTHDHPEGYPSLYRLYMQEEDVLEFRFAEKYFESYDHWVLITKASWMSPLIKRWRRHLEAKIRAAAFRKVLDISTDDGSKEQFKALTLLLKGGWKLPTDSRGRPSKDEIDAEIKKQTSLDGQTDADYDRIFNQQTEGTEKDE
jgi:hypothetical protein